jgi:hypothetical protein
MPNPPVREIVTVFKTHLDIGFTDLSRHVVRRYMDDFIPGALNLARKTRHVPNRFMWTTGSWLAWRFLEDSTPSKRRLMESAIEAGDFNWHALPFTTHTELIDPDLFEMGLQYSSRLDERFGRKTIAAKMTDVPGHTRGIVTQLAKAGVRLLHIGVNPASTVPSVPPVFVWRNGNAEIVVIYEKVYGALTPLPGGLCLSMNLTNDNLGPGRMDEIDKVYQHLREQFPEARVHADRLDVVAAHIWKRRKSLPVIEAEIGDTWIHGVGTDPAKVTRFRELSRLRLEWIARGKLERGGKTDIALSEPLLLIAEHTWGMDIKTHLRDNSAYTPKQLRSSLKKKNFQRVIRSWKEQREYLDQALQSLPARLRLEAQSRLKKLHTSRPGSGQPLKVGRPFTLGDWRLQVDSTGEIAQLIHLPTSRSCVAPKGGIGRFVYQTYSKADMERRFRQYCTLRDQWVYGDFLKPGLPAAARSHTYRPVVRGLRYHKSTDCVSVHLEFPPTACALGAPRESILHIATRQDGLDLRLDWFDKPANRMPEALWIAFQPFQKKGTPWRFDKLGVAVNPREVVRQGNWQLHGVTGKVTADDFSFTARDSILIAPGTPRLLDFTNRSPDLQNGISAVLYNNLWGTNFPMWYSGSDSFRFELRWRL